MKKPTAKSPSKPSKPAPSMLPRRRGIDLTTHKSLRIAVSGDVELNRLETEIVDAADFQRLRRIKQLGTAYLVYPTAVHTRFDHSLGVLAMAMQMTRAIRENSQNSDEERRIDPEEEQLLRLFALLHDIGHIPFGHTIEDEFCVFPRHDEDPDRIERFLGEGSEIGRLLRDRLGADLRERLMRLFRAREGSLDRLGHDLFIYDLVNNTVCADLLDYLRRDCHFCAISLDLDYRFLRYLHLAREGKTRRAVVRLWKEGNPTPRRDVISEMLRLLDNRYLMSERVYFHHAKLVSGAMVAEAVQRAKMSGELKKEDLCELGDETLLDRLARSRDAAAAKLARAVLDRRLWKLAGETTRGEIAAEQERVRDVDAMAEIMRRWWRDADGRAREEDRLAALLGMDPGDLLVHCPSARMSMKLAEMKVFWNGALIAFKDCKDDPIVGPKLSVILKSHENLWAARCFVNPARAGSAEKAAHAMECAFIFDPARRSREERKLFREVVDAIAAEERLAERLPHADYERRAEAAARRLADSSSAVDARAAVREAFQKE